jgi:RimJ/RimL family protein N-acetyltransferase
MTFCKGKLCELRVLEENDEEAKIWTAHVMHSQEHMKYVLTGSTPMRWFDIRDEWKREREKGAVLFGVWKNELRETISITHGNIEPCFEPVFIGTCGLYNPREIYHSYEARFMIVDPVGIGKGIGVEVAQMLSRYAFEKLNCHRLWLGVSAINLRAVKVYLDAGFQFEGKLEDDIFTFGAYWPVYRMGMTLESWKKWNAIER